MPRVKPVIKDNDLKNLPEVIKFNTTNVTTQGGINDIINNHIKNGLTLDQLLMIMSTSNRKIGKRFRDAVRESGTIPEDKINELPPYTPDEIKAKRALSMAALEQYASSQYLRNYKDTVLENALLDGKVTEAEKKELESSRDIMQLLLERGTDEKTEKDNLQRVFHMLGRDFNRSGMTEEEFEDRKARQYAEIFNAKMAKVISADYKRFHGFSDEELVKNWADYSETLTDIFVIRQEVDAACKKNKYIDRELAQKCIETEDRETELYALDAIRMRKIATPHYAETPLDFFDKVHGDALNDFEDYFNEHWLEDIQLSRLVTDVTGYASYEAMYVRTQIIEDLNTKTIGVTPGNVQLFDSQGKALSDLDDLMYAVKTTGVLAVPQNRPDLVTAYKFNFERRKTEVTELLPYLSVAEKITEGMPDLAARWDEEDRMVRGTELEQFFTNNADFSQNIQLFRELVAKAPHTEEMKAALVSKLQRTLAAEHPTTEGEELAQIIGLSPVETLSGKTVEERRQLTSQAVRKYAEYSFEDHPFLAVGANADAAAVKEMLMTRIGECEAFCSQYYGKKVTDADIVGDLEKFLDFGNGMGKGFKEEILDKCDKLGVKFTPEEMKRMQDASAKASALGDHASVRLNYILTAHYRYGGEEKLGNFANNSEIVMNLSDVELQRSANAALEGRLSKLALLGQQISALADPTGERIRDIVYDKEGNLIAGNDVMKIADEAAKTGQVMIFHEGDPNPVVVVVNDADSVPPQIAKAEMTPSLRDDIRSAKLQKAITEIGRNGYLTPAMKEMEEDIANREFELSSIAANLDKDPIYADRLKEKMSEYLARITVREMQKKLAESGAESTIPKDAIHGFATMLSKDPITDKVMDDIRKNPGAFDALKSDEVYRSLLKHKHEADVLEGEKKEAERRVLHDKGMESLKTIAKNYTYFRGMPAGNDSKLYGLNDEIKQAIRSNTPVSSFNISRAAVQALAASILINEGKDIKTLFDPEMQAERERAAKQAGKLFTGNKLYDIGSQLGNAMKALKGELVGKLDKMNDLSVAEFTKPENSYLLKVSSIFKDFTQEFDIAYGHLPDGPDKEKLNEFRTIQDEVEYPSAMITATGVPYRYFAAHEDKLFRPGNPDTYYTYQVIQVYVQSKMRGMAMQQWKEKPENQGKSVGELFGADAVVMSSYLNLAVNNSKPLDNIMRRCVKDRVFANKVFASILDDTFDKEIDLKLEANKDGSFNAKIDYDNAIKNLDNRMNINIPETVRRLEEMSAKQNASKPQKAPQALV